jgi:hypothetical protein
MRVFHRLAAVHSITIDWRRLEQTRGETGGISGQMSATQKFISSCTVPGFFQLPLIDF